MILSPFYRTIPQLIQIVVIEIAGSAVTTRGRVPIIHNRLNPVSIAGHFDENAHITGVAESKARHSDLRPHVPIVQAG